LLQLLDQTDFFTTSVNNETESVEKTHGWLHILTLTQKFLTWGLMTIEATTTAAAAVTATTTRL